MPIVISIVSGMKLNPIPYVYIASIGVNLSCMLPTSIRAIPVGYGLQPKYMLKKGSHHHSSHHPDNPAGLRYAQVVACIQHHLTEELLC